METQQPLQPSENQQGQEHERKLPRWVRPVIIIVAISFFAIGAVTWIWKIWGDWSAVMSAIFAISGTVSAFFAIPFLYSSSDPKPSKANTIAPSQSSISITVSPTITVSPHQSISTQSTFTDTKASQSTVEKPPLVDITNIQKDQKPAPHQQQTDLKPTEIPTDAVFLVNIPLPNTNEFYGRMLERTTLLNRTHQRACTSVVGPRRIGKTWLITHLCLVAAKQLDSNLHIGYIDVTMPSCATVAGFTTEALKALGFPPFSIPTNPSLDTLEQFIKDMKTKNQVPILCIDEFEGFTQRQDFDLKFFTELRAITQAGLGLVTISKDPLIDIVSENVKSSPFFNVFLQLKLRPFDARDAKKFVRDKGTQAGFTDQEQDSLLKYGQKGEQQWPPLRLQLMGETLLGDKRLGTHYYRPGDLDYWLEFKERLEDTYQGMVKQ